MHGDKSINKNNTEEYTEAIKQSVRNRGNEVAAKEDTMKEIITNRNTPKNNSQL